MPSKAIHVITLAEALPNHIEEVHQLLQDLANLHRQEEGCLRFDIYADKNNPARLNTIEVWESEQAHQKHMNSALVAKSILMFFGKVRKVPDVRILGIISEMTL
jgi:quinol monooxygenase YgiN